MTQDLLWRAMNYREIHPIRLTFTYTPLNVGFLTVIIPEHNGDLLDGIIGDLKNWPRWCCDLY